jgi:hypothetical protein
VGLRERLGHEQDGARLHASIRRHPRRAIIRNPHHPHLHENKTRRAQGLVEGLERPRQHSREGASHMPADGGTGCVAPHGGRVKGDGSATGSPSVAPLLCGTQAPQQPGGPAKNSLCEFAAREARCRNSAAAVHLGTAARCPSKRAFCSVLNQKKR